MILKSTVADVTALNLLVNSAFRGESSKKGWTTEADLLGGIRVDEEKIKELINKNDSLILKYLNEEKIIIGCVHLEKHGSKLFLGMLTVTPELQTQGIGKKLMKESEKIALGFNCSSIYMTVITARRELIDWYRKHGYKNTGIKKPFPSNDPRFGLPKQPLEFVLLEKSLLG